MRYTYKTGFSLFELSVVLLIIGLFAGGVVAGNNLLESSRISKTIKALSELANATQEFETQYGQLPGDFNNATSIWPSCVDDGTYNTCNGDHLNGIESVEGAGDASATVKRETWRALQHLSLAEMIDGNYTGIKTAGGSFRIGENTMAGGIPGLGMLPKNNLSIWMAGLIINNSVMFGAALTPYEGYIIDTKIDDGGANTGLYKSSTGISSGMSSCLDGSSQYDLTNKNVSCTSDYTVKVAY